MSAVEVKVTYLEMRSRPAGAVPAPRDGLTVVQVKRPTVSYYRFLYNTVGRDYHWRSRRIMPDAELDALLQNPRTDVYVLHADGTPAGFVEFDRPGDGAIEITQFGLMPEFIGQGLGKYLLRWAIDRAWDYGPTRLWLHTCTLDHPVALANYLKGGFVICKEEMIRREL